MLQRHTQQRMDRNANVSFAGCGFIGIYHIGVSACLKQFAPHLLMNKIGGSSAGAMCAVALVCDLSLVDMARNVVTLAYEINEKLLGPFNPSVNLHQKLKNAFESLFPENVAEQCNEKCFISITKASNKSNLLISEFESKEDLVEAVSASSFVPMMSGYIPPKFRGQYALDGGYSDNIPYLGGYTITVSPFAGDASICPSEESFHSLLLSYPHGTGGTINLSTGNFRKLGDAIIPPNTRKMKEIFVQGYNDAKRYLQCMEMIKCGRCLEQEEVPPNNVQLNCQRDCDTCQSLQEQATHAKYCDQFDQLFDEIEARESEKSSDGLGSYILSLPATVASNTSRTLATLSPLTSVLSNSIMGTGKKRMAMLQLLGLSVAPAKTLFKLQPSIKQCPFVDI